MKGCAPYWSEVCMKMAMPWMSPGTDRRLQYLDTYEYEVAIVDWRMPKVSGLEVIQRLRRRGSSLPILMLTARDAASDRVTGLDEGADDYLVKPLDFPSC